MKLTKRYRELMKGKEEEAPVVQLKELKAILNNCGIKNLNGKDSSSPNCDCPQDCAECDDTFFHCLRKDMFWAVNFFNKNAQELLETHSASGFHKFILLLNRKLRGKHPNYIQKGQDLITYAATNGVAIQKILKEYDKNHCSMKGQRFSLEAQFKHLELLKSPWLFELMAFQINLRLNKRENDAVNATTSSFECSLSTDDGKTVLVALIDSISVDLDLICPICLETVFYPVALTCSHIFCHRCACAAASVAAVVDGLKTARPTKKCPICRQAGVYGDVVHLHELNLLLSRSLPEHWKERVRRERKELLQQAKEQRDIEIRFLLGY